MAWIAGRSSGTTLGVSEEPRIGTYFHPESSVVYYARRRVEPCANAAEVALLFATEEVAYVITSRTRYEQDLRGKLPQDVGILLAEPRFLKSEDVVLLGRAARVAERSRSSLQ
jgi:hypothetical protein